MRRFTRRRVSKRRARIMRAPRDMVITRIASTNQGGANAFPMFLITDSSGRHAFQAGTTTPVTATYVAMEFYMQGFAIKSGVLTSMSIATVPGYSEFAAMFDAYVVDRVEVMVLPTYSMSNGLATTGAFVTLPNVIHALDFDDSTPQGFSDLAQKTGAKYTQFLTPNGAPVRPLRVFRPKANIAMYRSATSFSYGPLQAANQFINCSYPDVPHYGMKLALDDSYGNLVTNTTLAQLNFVVKFHYRFRGVQ